MLTEECLPQPTLIAIPVKTNSSKRGQLVDNAACGKRRRETPESGWCQQSIQSWCAAGSHALALWAMQFFHCYPFSMFCRSGSLSGVRRVESGAVWAIACYFGLGVRRRVRLPWKYCRAIYSEAESLSPVHFSLARCQVLSGLYRSIFAMIFRESGPKSASYTIPS